MDFLRWRPAVLCSCGIFLLKGDLDVPLRAPKLIMKRKSIDVYFRGRSPKL
jgi:hypothetical protein